MSKIVLAGRVGREGTSVTVTGDTSRIRGVLNGTHARKDHYMVKRVVMRHQRNAAEEAARETQEGVRDKTPKRSHRTANSVRRDVRRVGDTVIGTVSSDHPNIDRLEEGTGLYGPKRRMIRSPRPGGVMRFPRRPDGFRLTDAIRQVGGVDDPRARFVYARKVRGQRPNRMFKRTATEMRVRAPIIFRKHAALAAREIKARL